MLKNNPLRYFDEPRPAFGRGVLVGLVALAVVIVIAAFFAAS